MLSLLLTCLLIQQPAPSTETYQIGLAKVDITPAYNIRLNGFGGRRTESEGITQPIWARALVIGEKDPVVILAVDTLGVSEDQQEELATRLKKAGIQEDHLFITSTHTHTAPMLKGVTPTIFGTPIPAEHQRNIDRYTVMFLDKLEEVSLASLKNRQPATLSYAIGSLGFATNRRTQNGPVDHDLPVFFIHDAAGKLVGLWCNYACHCVTLSNNKISGDWAGYATAQMDADLPGVTSLVSIGCGADSNPNSGVTGDKVQIAKDQGLLLSREVYRLSRGKTNPVAGSLIAKRSRFTLPLDTIPDRKTWEEKAKRQDAVGHHARTQLARLDAGTKLPEAIPYSVSSLTFGKSLAMLFFPGEVVVDYALRLKKELDSARLFVHAYSNGAPCYIPSERILKEGGYEGGGAMIYYDVPVPLKTGLEETIIKEAKSLLPDFPAPFDGSKVTTSPKSPQQSLKTLRTSGNFEIELVAAEPMVIDPVAINFGPDGELWVAEMNDYPTGKDAKFTPGGRIRLLTSSKNDGHYDKSSIFLENIPFPTGITPWKKGVLICAAPDILYAEDTQGTGKADVVKKLYSGFGTTNYQARVNSLEYGLDGWVHGSCGLFGGRITSFISPTPFTLGNRDFRIKPDTGEIEPSAGQTQQGRARDDWGNWFGCDNSTLARHYPLSDELLRRNQAVAPPVTAVFVPADKEANKIYPAVRPQMFALSGPSGQATAACGLGFYRDTLLGEDYQNNLFTCESVNLAVHRLQLHAKNNTFTGHRAATDKETEFLTSTDNWFRPVQVRTGPDGAFYIVDMYRFIIEHPMWIPPEERPKLDFHAGNTLGRIYRIKPVNKPLRPIPMLSKLSPEQIVEAMNSENGTLRDLAMQWMLWYPNPAYHEPLRKLALSSTIPQARMQAIATLHQLRQTDEAVVLTALKDKHSEVRKQAVIAARSLNWSKELQTALTELPRNHSPLMLELAVTLRKWNEAAPLLAEVINSYYFTHPEDQFFLTAVLTSLTESNIETVLKHSLAQPSPAGFDSKLLQPAVPMLPEAKQLPFLNFIMKLQKDKQLSISLNGYAGLLQGCERSSARNDLLKHPLLAEVTQQARAEVTSRSAKTIEALQLLGRVPSEFTADKQLIEAVLTGKEPIDLQKAALSAISRWNNDEAATLLISRWKFLLPPQQLQVIDILLSRSNWTMQLLQSLESGTITKERLDAATRQRLLSHTNTTYRDWAAKLFANIVGQRNTIVQKYTEALSIPGDITKGEAVYTRACAGCHQLHGKGHAIGPDLTTLLHKAPSYLLAEIFDPNRNVDARYLSYIASLKSGQQFTGLLTNESSNSITLSEKEGKSKTILRSELDELTTSGKSLMPEGLEAELTIKDVANLFAYLADKPLPSKVIHGNTPKLISLEEGKFALLARYAFIYGKQITFEAPFYNIGYWQDRDDLIYWDIEVKQTAKFDLYIDYSCASDSAGNTYTLTGLAKHFTAKVEGTGGWDKYQQKLLTTIELTPGKHRLRVSITGDIFKNALMDLRGLYLVPTGTALKLVAQEPPRESLKPNEVASLLLDASKSAEQKNRALQNLTEPAEVLKYLTQDLKPGAPEEYQRIGYIWRVAITSSKTNDSKTLRELLSVSLPKVGDPLRDWQAVVIGGGVINAISQNNLWPAARIKEVIGTDADLQNRWNAILPLAITMAENDKVPTGTRYDALRIIPLDDWKTAAPLLKKYLAKGIHAELQQGAVSGLADVEHNEVALLLLEALTYLTGENQKLALAALLRTPVRVHKLLDAIEAKKLPREILSADQWSSLKKHPEATIRDRTK